MNSVSVNRLVKSIFLFMAILITVSCAQQTTNPTQSTDSKIITTEPTTVIYLVRHAEKKVNEGKNPSLTAEGRLRAQHLATVLADVKLSAIYSTPYKRTLETATPIAEMKQIKITEGYISAELFAGILVKANRQENVLVVGHSNTTPELIKALGVNSEVTIGHDQYGDLFVVEVNGNKAELRVLSF